MWNTYTLFLFFNAEFLLYLTKTFIIFQSSGQTFEYESEDGKTVFKNIENDLFVRKDIVKKYNVNL